MELAPSHQRQLSDGFLRVLANNGDGLGGRNIEAGIPFWVVGNGSVEVLFSDLLSPGKSEAPAHGGIMADWSAVVRLALEAVLPRRVLISGDISGCH